MIMAVQYMQAHPLEADKNLLQTADKHLTSGYKRLVGYRCKKGGYEWFGTDPGHEALTAYGILEFIELSKVTNGVVDQKMISETKDWLFALRNGKGGFNRNSLALDCFGAAPEHTTNGYILWALAQAGIKLNEIKLEFDAVYNLLKTKKGDAYFVAMLCSLCAILELHDKSEDLANELIKLQQDGKIAKAETSITNSSGSSLLMETTAMACIAWMQQRNYKNYVPNLSPAIKWIRENCKGGNFGNTQATVLALKAIVTSETILPSGIKEGSIVLKLNGNEVASEGVDKTTVGNVSLKQFGDKITSGKCTLELEMLEGSTMPFSVEVKFYTKSFNSSPQCNVDLFTKLRVNNTIKAGESTEVEVKLKNKKPKDGIPMTIAIIGLPGGLEVRVENLKELVKKGVIAYYELFGAREVVFYWRYMGPDQEIAFNFDVIAAIPGHYTGPPSRAYLYYTNEFKTWVPPLAVTIT